MNDKTRKVRLSLVTIGIAFSLAALISCASAQTTSSIQHGMMQMMETSAQQQVESPTGGCSMAGGMTGEKQGGMSGMMGRTDDSMSCGMMSDMMGDSSGHMSGGMMGGIHNTNPLVFSKELELTSDQVDRLRELQIATAISLMDAQEVINKGEIDVRAAYAQLGDLKNLELALRSAADASVAYKLLQASQAARVREVLTPDQRERWATLKQKDKCDMDGGEACSMQASDHTAHHPPPR